MGRLSVVNGCGCGAIFFQACTKVRAPTITRRRASANRRSVCAAGARQCESCAHVGACDAAAGADTHPPHCPRTMVLLCAVSIRHGAWWTGEQGAPTASCEKTKQRRALLRVDARPAPDPLPRFPDPAAGPKTEC